MIRAWLKEGNVFYIYLIKKKILSKVYRLCTMPDLIDVNRTRPFVFAESARVSESQYSRETRNGDPRDP